MNNGGGPDVFGLRNRRSVFRNRRFEDGKGRPVKEDAFTVAASDDELVVLFANETSCGG
jgi:hypothetical protein